jgi:hypothetical protein
MTTVNKGDTIHYCTIPFYLQWKKIICETKHVHVLSKPQFKPNVKMAIRKVCKILKENFHFSQFK